MILLSILKSKNYLILFIIIQAIACSDYCKVYNDQEVNNLRGNNSIVAWISKCGASGQNSIHLTWGKRNSNLKNSIGEIFEAYNGENIKIEKLSEDTVVVYYFAWDVVKKRENDRGITFIFESKGLDFFDKY